MRRDQRGQAMVIFAGSLTVLLLAAGLVVDGGVAFYNRREAQNEADLAVLAGTQEIALHYTDDGRSGSDVFEAIGDSLAANDCSPSAAVPCTWTAAYIRPTSGGGEVQLGAVTQGGSIPVGAQGVAIEVQRKPDTFFLGLVDQDTWDVDAVAAGVTARSGGLPAGQVLPIAVDPPHNHFQPNGVYELTAGKDAPGNFSWLSWSNSESATLIAESLCNPDNPAMSFDPPLWIPGDSGKMNSSAVRACLDKWIDSGTTVLLPMWDEVQGQGTNTEFRITGLGAFVIMERGHPAIDSIKGRFVEYYPLPTIGANATWGAPPCAGTVGCGDQTVFIGLTR